MYDRCPDNRLSPASDKQPPPDRRPGRDYLRRRLIRASNWRVPRYRRPGEAAGPGSPSCFSPLSANTSERSNRTLTPPRPPAPSDVAIPLDGAKIGLFQLRCERGLRVHLQGWPLSRRILRPYFFLQWILRAGLHRRSLRLHLVSNSEMPSDLAGDRVRAYEYHQQPRGHISPGS